MADKVKQRIRSCAGFSLTEMLVATLIMLMATSLLTQCMQIGIRQFQESTKRSKAQTLCDTLCTYVETELSYASVKVSDGKVTSFSSDVHNMGPDTKFVIVQKTSSETAGAADQIKDIENNTGILAETSEYYQSVKGEKAYYSIVGEGSYKTGNNGSKSLQAEMQPLAWDFVNKSVTVSIAIYDPDDTKYKNPLAQRQFHVIPLSVVGSP